jgi:site-specific DNA-adenine methylase
MNKIDAPFVWFGGKKLVADKVWQALGNVDHYVEPFFGGLYTELGD